MIEAAVGLPGAGKSLWSVGHRIIPALKDGRLVVTNVPLNLRGLRIECGEFIDPLLVELKKETLGREPFSDIQDFTTYDTWRKEGDKGQGPLFVIDECHVALADCIGLNAGKNPIVDWFAKHRHTGSDVVLMTQLEKGIPSAVRGRVEIFFKFIRKGFMGRDNAFRMNAYDNAGVKMPVHEDGTYNKNWFKCYQSHVPGAAEQRAKRPSIWTAPQFKFMAAALALIIGWVVYNGGVSLPGITTKPKEKSVAESKPVDASAPQSAAGPAAPSVDLAAYDQEIAELDRKIAVEQRKVQLARVIAGCDIGAPSAGGFIGGVADAATSGGGTAKEPCEIKKPLRYMHDQVHVKISGHMFVNAQHTYWIAMERDGVRWVDRGETLENFGFKLMGLDGCNAYLRGDRGVFKISCEAMNLIGYEDAVPLEQVLHEPVVVEHKAEFDSTGSATITLKKPVTASE